MNIHKLQKRFKNSLISLYCLWEWKPKIRVIFEKCHAQNCWVKRFSCKCLRHILFPWLLVALACARASLYCLWASLISTCWLTWCPLSPDHTITLANKRFGGFLTFLNTSCIASQLFLSQTLFQMLISDADPSFTVCRLSRYMPSSS